MLISIVINCDTRPEQNNQNGRNKGVVSRDFLIDGVLNKIKFFDGFDKEVILFIDEHESVLPETIEKIKLIVDCLVIRKHTSENKFNDNNYVSALQLARGEYIAHFDQDTAAFTSSKKCIDHLINELSVYDYISYPSHWSPKAAYDDNYDYVWASTRFFVCKRDSIDITEIKKCLDNSDYLYGKYPASVRNPWTEHCLGLISKYTGKGVYYPPVNISDYTIFSWGSYKNGILNALNNMPYEEVINFINSKGGIRYPCDIHI